MSNTKKDNNTLPKGAFFVATTNEFEVTSMNGIFLVKEEFDVEQVRKEWFLLNPSSNTQYDFPILDFIKWILSKELIERVTASFEWCIDGNTSECPFYLDKI